MFPFNFNPFDFLVRAYNFVCDRPTVLMTTTNFIWQRLHDNDDDVIVIIAVVLSFIAVCNIECQGS